jgi:hypothetical protein
MDETGHEARCERHVGEVHVGRCADCDAAVHEQAQDSALRPLWPVPLSEDEVDG